MAEGYWRTSPSTNVTDEASSPRLFGDLGLLLSHLNELEDDHTDGDAEFASGTGQPGDQA